MEVLITMVVMLFGLVGLTQMFVKAQRTAIEAYDRHRALSMANYMAEVMRSMVRLKPTNGAVSATERNTCPQDGQIPADGVLTNEQIMACFVSLSSPAGAGNAPLGMMLNEPTGAAGGLGARTEPAVKKAAVLDCVNPSKGCNHKQMVNYMLNVWTEMLAAYNQDAPTPPTGRTAVFSARNFSGRGCITHVCDNSGEPFDATKTCAQGLYRVTVFWSSEESVTPDINRRYCGLTPQSYWRYTFVDVAMPSPTPTQN
jgi:hypothetical protein